MALVNARIAGVWEDLVHTPASHHVAAQEEPDDRRGGRAYLASPFRLSRRGGCQLFVRFALEAQELFDEWRAELEQEALAAEEDNPVLLSHLAEYRSLRPTLAFDLPSDRLGRNRACFERSQPRCVSAVQYGECPGRSA